MFTPHLASDRLTRWHASRPENYPRGARHTSFVNPSSRRASDPSGLPDVPLVIAAASAVVGGEEVLIRYILACKILNVSTVIFGSVTINPLGLAAPEVHRGPDDTGTAITWLDLDVGDVVADTDAVRRGRAELQ